MRDLYQVIQVNLRRLRSLYLNKYRNTLGTTSSGRQGSGVLMLIALVNTARLIYGKPCRVRFYKSIS